MMRPTNNYEYIKVKIQGQILSLTLNRPSKKNALNQKMIQEINSVLDKNKASENIRVILISSNSDVFCAGADLEYLEKIKDFKYKEHLQDSRELMSLFKNMLQYPKLIIAKVTGAAIAGGCGLMTASDITFATKESKFGYPEVKIGFTPALVSTFILQKIHETKARELMLTGNIISAEEAKQIGLINYLYSNIDIDDKLNEFINLFVKSTSSNSIKNTKQVIYDSMNLDIKLEKAAELNALTRMHSDFKKGINSFLNKEPINWQEK